MAEELVVQHPAMAELYPTSVNTVRILTIYGKIVDATLRMGNGGSFLDNASSGGIFAPVDIETGRITAEGIDYLGKANLKHPHDRTPYSWLSDSVVGGCLFVD